MSVDAAVGMPNTGYGSPLLIIGWLLTDSRAVTVNAAAVVDEATVNVKVCMSDEPG